MTAQSTLKFARRFLAVLVAAGLVAGLAARFTGSAVGRDRSGCGGGAGVGGALVEIVTSLRRGDVGLDIVAALSMSAALAFGESLAAAIVALMYAGGQFLEAFAERAARREMTALLSRVPRTAMRHVDGQLEEVALELIVPGDRLLIRQGDVVPVDGTVAYGVAVLDQSALTGEAMPVRRGGAEPVLSGSTNVGDAFDLTATRLAAESTYAGVIRLVESAQRSRAPMSRMADKFSIVFLAVTVGAGDRGVVADRRSDPRGGGAGGRDAVSAHSGGAGRDRLRAVARRQARHSDQRRRAPSRCWRGCARWSSTRPER